MSENITYQRIHLIAIGGAIMHNLALALAQGTANVTGSDDEIYEPARSRLQAAGLLPAAEGWFTEKITPDLDAVIVGMHARPDNPELARAQQLGIKIFSFPEFIYEQARNKQRVVVAGSHGKTTITSMILHVLKHHGRKFDYAVGAQIEGFERMVKLSPDAPVIIIEGDEYLTSPLDPRPKFLHYHHHIGVISGIAWDHINVFPTFDKYFEQFKLFVQLSPKAGTLIYNKEDEEVARLCSQSIPDVQFTGYNTHPHEIQAGKTRLKTKNEGLVEVAIFGGHNLQNLNAAMQVCLKLGVSEKEFYQAIQQFKGAARRLEVLFTGANTAAYRDFAHAPSKVKATTQALKTQFPERRLVACLELHTFSSLNRNFLPQYNGALQAAHEAIVYFNPKTIAHKKLEPLEEADIRTAFGMPDLKVFTSSQQLFEHLEALNWKNSTLLLMSSGNFDNIDLPKLVSNTVGSAALST